jgi:hypothetical protein
MPELPDSERLSRIVSDLLVDLGPGDACAVANEVLSRVDATPEPRRSSPRRFAPHRRRFRPVRDDE